LAATSWFGGDRRRLCVVYAKPPFSGPEAVLAYLARYTRRVAIANSRLIALDERGVTFRYKDYRRNGQARYRTMTLSADEFIRRPTKGLSSHPPLWAAGQRRLQGQHRACQGADRRRSAARRSAAGGRRSRSGRHDRSSPAMPVLRWPHDYCRGPCARRPTARPALWRRDQDLRR